MNLKMLLFASVSLVLFASCHNSDDPYMTLATKTLDVEAEGGLFTVDLSSNVYYRVNNDCQTDGSDSHWAVVDSHETQGEITKFTIKGSGRSIEAYSMFDKMTEVAELFTKYGGHPMAAGLSMREEDIDKLREQLNQKAELSEEDMAEVVRLDAVLPMSYFTVDTIRQLSVLEPCGKSNTKPVFADRNIKITRAGIVGVNRNVLKLHLLDSKGNPVAGVYFGEVEKFLTFLSEKFGSEEVDAAMHGKENSIQFAAVYEPAVDTYSGRESVQAIIRRFR